MNPDLAAVLAGERRWCVITGDCRDVMASLPSALVVTDPPFNVGYHYESHDDNMGIKDYQELLRVSCRLPSVVTLYPEGVCALSWTLEEQPMRMVAWVYPSNTARQWRCIGWFGCQPDFDAVGQPYRNPSDRRIAQRMAEGKTARLYDWWQIDQVKNVSADKTEHPCQMPVEVMQRVVGVTAADLILDPFCGSGTTGVAALQLGRRFIGIEIDPKYADIARTRCDAADRQGRLNL